VSDTKQQSTIAPACPAPGRRRAATVRAKSRTRGHVDTQASSSCCRGVSTGLTLAISAELIEQIVERAAEFVAERQQRNTPEPLLTVDQLAETLATTPEWVRRHQADLGAFRLSDGGGRNPIRFRASEVERFLAARRLRPRERVSMRSWRSDPDWASG
jgi:hypothetical protein